MPPEALLPLLQWLGITSVLSAIVLGISDGIRHPNEF